MPQAGFWPAQVVAIESGDGHNGKDTIRVQWLGYDRHKLPVFHPYLVVKPLLSRSPLEVCFVVTRWPICPLLQSFVAICTADLHTMCDVTC